MPNASTTTITRADLDRLVNLACEGSGVCQSPLHVHGCYSDRDGTACDEPAEHPTAEPEHDEACVIWTGDGFTCDCGNDDAATRQGAPRPALDEEQDGRGRQTSDRVEQLGAAVSVRQLTPASAGHAVRLVVDGPLWLEPADAHAIADALNAAALEAIHADRAGRHRG